MDKPRVIRVHNVMGYSPPGAAGKYISRLLIDGESVGSKNLVLNHFTLHPGESTYLGSHPDPYEEVYYVLRGVGVLLLGGPDGDRYPVSPHSVAYIPSGMPHQLTNVGQEPLEMLTMMPFHPEPGANPLYDERKREWGTSFRQVGSAGSASADGDSHGAEEKNGQARMQTGCASVGPERDARAEREHRGRSGGAS